MASTVRVICSIAVFLASVAIWGSCGILMLLRMFAKAPLHFFSRGDHDKLPQKAAHPDLGVHSHVVLKNQLKIKYVAKGDKGKPLMLCVHGFPECWYSWRHQLKEFSKKYRVVAIDLPGYGDSDKPNGRSHYTVTTLVDNIAEIIQELGYERATVVAHDWGGALIWHFAGTYSSMCEKVVIMNAPNRTGFQKGFSFKQYLCSWYMFFFQLPWIPELMMGACDYQFMNQCFQSDESGTSNKENITDEDVDVYKHALRSWEARNCAVNYYRANNMLRRSVATTTAEQKPVITAPVLLIWGTEDKALTIELAAKSASVSELVTVEYVDGASHWVQQDKPEEVNRLMWAFLN